MMMLHQCVEGDVIEVVLVVEEAVVHHTDRCYHMGGGGCKVVRLGRNLVARYFGLAIR